MPCRTTQDRWVTLKSSDKAWSAGEGNGNPLQYSYLENPMGSMKKHNAMTSEDEPPRPESVQQCSAEEWGAITNSSRKNEVAGPKWKQYSAVEIASLAQWTWIWANSRRQRRTGEPSNLQSMGSERVRHDLATEQQQQMLTAVPLTPSKAWKQPILFGQMSTDRWMDEENVVHT